MKKKLVTLKFNTKKGVIKLPKSINKKFHKSYNSFKNLTMATLAPATKETGKKSNYPDYRDETKFEKQCVVFNNMVIIPFTHDYYSIEKLISTAEKREAYERLIEKEESKKDNIDGVYFNLEFEHGDIKPFGEILPNSYFMYNNRVYVKYTNYAAKRLDDLLPFSEVIKAEDVLNRKLDRRIPTRKPKTVNCEILVIRDKRL